jgi:hypothetical protein
MFSVGSFRCYLISFYMPSFEMLLFCNDKSTYRSVLINFLCIILRVTYLLLIISYLQIFSLIINSMEPSPSWESASRSTTQEFLKILLNIKVHCRAHKIPPLVPILSQINPAHITPSDSYKINFNIILSAISKSSSGFFPSGFPTKYLYAFHLSQSLLHHLPILFIVITELTYLTSSLYLGVRWASQWTRIVYNPKKSSRAV